MVNGIDIKKTLGSGSRVFGCMLSAMGVTRFRSSLAGSTMDFVVIDSEHGSRDRKEIQELCRMLRDIDIAPIVRIPIPMSHWVAIQTQTLSIKKICSQLVKSYNLQI